MASRNISIKADVYERLKAHKRDDERVSEALDRLFRELDSD
jgi:predicted CopG family antitoxin